jgi:1-deoxy-D-xylulose-5-phosphate reductoisomerase
MGDSVKTLAILGSTGSIGRQTLDVVRALSRRFKIAALAAGNNTTLLAEQVEEFRPEFVYFTGDETPLSQTGVRCDKLSLEEIASHPDIDTIVIATSGKAGLQATLAAARAGKRIALSNKESLVMAGEIITAEARKHNAEILPVDSEHSAIWQCLRGETRPARLILTASGGPFRGYSAAELEKVTAEQALKHPSWQMGKKVTIDSATLMNKGLEIIEARWLFDIPVDRINVVIHPQSIIHSMVEFEDGSVKAQMSYPDMRMPIQYALTYPERLPNEQLRKIDWTEMKDLTFGRPDPDAFPCLGLAVEAVRKGGTYPAALCSADEAAVELFLSHRTGFMDIPRLVGRVLAGHETEDSPSLEQILAADSKSREEVYRLAGGVNP